MARPPASRQETPSPLPERIAPMMAQFAAEAFDSAGHSFEIKWDGARCLAFVERGGLRLQNRRFVQMHARYPELAVLRGLPAGTVVDGEIVVLDGGKPSFTRLQQRDHLVDGRRLELLSRRMPATLMVFDLLYDRGRCCMEAPLHERRERLSALVGQLADPHVLVPDFVIEQGVAYFAAVESHGLEGVMAKRLDSPYQPGKRSPDWIKIKVATTGEFDVLGYVPREGNAIVSALVLGMPYRGRWMYKGKVGSGLGETERAEMFQKLCRAPALPDPPPDGPKDAVWCASGLKCRVRYLEKTVTGKLRGPVFLEFVE